MTETTMTTTEHCIVLWFSLSRH